ncbi:small subunit ribosomal protein S1 [Weissella beninensis]|uniref:30S ribosomal protein S1 n=1 Tax=Periweissella beninensis TaxID=504936 RepID=A0ABT0VN45_9LACO|nr:30S ribosomal protein S1 [Periweissella beninensis]MBM7544676.1 small subunit ribosomal protein S1 [Periweissella beninensis]MCM2437950.1 30S ribosomal protein S1 [Periweissella beninensis]
MNEENNELLAALDAATDIKVGDVVKGEILVFDDQRQAIVGIEGTGVEGVIPAREYSSKPDADMTAELKVGDVLDLVVIRKIGSDKEGGSYLLSKKRLEARLAWDKIEKDHKPGDVLEVPVIQAVRGGLVVDAGVRGFIPASMIENRFVSDLNQYKGQTVRAQIVEIDPADNRLILSRRAVIDAERSEAIEKVFGTLNEGDVVEGKVARMTDFGAFVDLGGVDGLVHVSEISYDRVSKPADVLKAGETVKVKVLGLDKEKQRISLSIKQTQPGPWEKIATEAPEGTVLEGTVKRLTDFGAFVQVAAGVEGLVHISQISHKHVESPAEVLKSGETVKVKVLSVDPAAQRLSLSIKALEERPASEKKEDKQTDNKQASSSEIKNYTADEEEGFTIGDILGDDFSK